MKSTRRMFLTQTAFGLSAVALSPVIPGCTAAKPIPGRMLGPNHQAGHWLRGGLPQNLSDLPTETVSVKVLIVGGGVSGLSARRWLEKQGMTDIVMLELEAQAGGNAASGQNAVSAFPWGAHYLPIPDVRNRELLEFLQTSGSITGFDANGLPICNEYHLCHDPEERLFINGDWQEGLVPELGVPETDKQQIRRFFALIETLKNTIGNDGRDVFAIPLDRSSTDDSYRALDRQSFDEYLAQQGFTSSYLRWYLDYSCQDDYGATLAQTSAWAGLHYFASRKGKAANAPSSAVLTWPEGNGFLVRQLRQQASSPIRTNTIAYSIEVSDTGIRAIATDLTHSKKVAITAQYVIVATPAFIARRLLTQSQTAPSNPKPETLKLETLNLEPETHMPWLVANLTVDALPQGRGMPLCWDNVVYGANSVGYICANHQDLTDSSRRVITYYKLLTDSTLTMVEEAVRRVRQRAFSTTREQWLTEIVKELETAHPGIADHIQEADIWVWGHGMIAPTPGYLWHSDRQEKSQPLEGRVFFAHTDYSGISIFEEAFYQGIRAAEQISSRKKA